jgi:hypothetical protein
MDKAPEAVFTHVGAPELDVDHGIVQSMGRCDRCGRAIDEMNPDPTTTIAERVLIASPPTLSEEEPVHE